MELRFPRTEVCPACSVGDAPSSVMNGPDGSGHGHPLVKRTDSRNSVPPMPSRANRMCPRCGNPYNGRRCQICFARGLRTLGLRNQRTGPSPYDSKQWRDFSRAFLRDHRTCECVDCMKLPEVMRPRSQITDHIDGLGPSGPRGFDPTNMQAMTIPCHGRKTARFDGGFGRPKQRFS